MKALRGRRAVALTFFHSYLVAAQIATGTGGTNVLSQSPPPFPISANSSSVVTVSVSSTLPLGTGTTISSATSTTNAPSSSDTNAPLTETSIGSLLPSGSSLTPTDTLSSSNSSSIPTNTLSFSISRSIPTNTLPSTDSSVIQTGSVKVSTTDSSAAPDSSTKSITDGPSSTNSVILPPGITETSSASDGIILPPGITLPPNPSTTLSSTGTEMQSSASDLSIIFAGIFPLIQSWIDHSDAPEITAVTNGLDNILPKATDFLAKLPKPTDGVEPCKSGRRRRSEPERIATRVLDKRSFLGGLFKTAFSLVTCVIDTTNKVKDGVIKGTTDAVKNLQNDLKPMVDALNEVEPNENPKPSGSASEGPTSTQSETSSSSSSCTLQTVSNCNIGCTASAVTTLGGPIKRAANDACTTVCGAPITKCGATGVTSVSTVTSTTTTYQLCAQDCASCNAIPTLPTDGPDLAAYSKAYSKASNGVLYLPGPTVTALDGDNPAAEARGLIPKQTGSPSSNLQKRRLTNPYDHFWGGNVAEWLIGQILLSNNGLAHGQQPLTTTGFTYPLGNVPDTWKLVDLYGCTSVIVISRKRMFMTHIWENPTMVEPANLQPQVLDVLRNGYAGVPQGLTAFTGPGGDFENIPENKVRAFIITPYDRDHPHPTYNDLQYPNQVTRIKDLLQNVLGRSDTLPIPYRALGPDDDIEFPFGKVLIQYDPADAWLDPGDGSCITQVAGVELWFEDFPTYRYKDNWIASPNQNMFPPTLPGRSISGDGKEVRWLRGREVTDADEEEWKEYESLMKRQGGGSCSLPSRSGSASSTSPPSSTGKDPTTLQTSVVSSSSGGGTTPSIKPPSSTQAASTTTTTTTTEQAPSSTEAPPSETSAPAPTSTPTPSPTPTPNKAVSIIMMNLNNSTGNHNSWTFFETSVGSQADGCSDPVLDDQAKQWSDPDAIDHPPWPHGTFTMTLFTEANCQYSNDGTGPGTLHCPAMGEGNNVDCKEDSEKSLASATTQCEYSLSVTRAYHRAVYCEYWDTS